MHTPHSLIDTQTNASTKQGCCSISWNL